MLNTSLSPYQRAAYLPKLERTRKIVFTDLDGTMTEGVDPPSPQELADRRSVRNLLESRGVVSGAVTARTAGLTLSNKMFLASESVRGHEWPPQWGKDPLTGRRTGVQLEEVPFFESCLDFDFTASFGSIIAIRNGEGYMVDTDFFEQLRFDHDRSRPSQLLHREPWRHAMREFQMYKLSEFTEYESPLERITNYHSGLTDCAPLNFRIQYNFVGREGFEAMTRLKSIISDEQQKSRDESQWYHVALRIKMVDESKPHPTDPEKSRYTLYLIPWSARKENMIHRVFTQSVSAAGLEVKDTKLFYAGDTLTDLRAGLYAGGGAEFTFLLATGSRLAPYILERRSKFGDEDLSFLWQSAESRLVKTPKKGVYKFVHKIRKNHNTIVIGDVRYPTLTAPGSVHAFLQEFL